MYFSRTTVLVLCAFFGIASRASAASVTWTLHDVEFNEQGSGSLSGSFNYDWDTGTYSSINLTSTNRGSIFDGVCIQFCTQTYFQTVNGAGNLTGDYAIFLQFASALTDAGGTVLVALADDGLCSNQPFCGTYSTLYDEGDTGTVQSGAATPEPSTLVLLSSAAAILGFRKTLRNR
jgi:hypothetical protein